MTVSSVTKVRSSIIHATEVSDGAGVRLKRTIGSTVLRHLDPFLMLDYFSSDNPSDYIAGFPSHPHRGFATFTYMIEGDMEHKDSMGNTGNLGSGGGQWMKAGSGVIHSEMPKQEDGLMRGYQLWINLPAANKFDPPEYQEYKSASFPVVDESDTTVKVIMETTVMSHHRFRMILHKYPIMTCKCQRENILISHSSTDESSF